MLLANGPFCAAEGELFLELFDVAAMTELIGFALWGVATAIPLISSLNVVD